MHWIFRKASCLHTHLKHIHFHIHITNRVRKGKKRFICRTISACRCQIDRSVARGFFYPLCSERYITGVKYKDYHEYAHVFRVRLEETWNTHAF